MENWGTEKEHWRYCEELLANRMWSQLVKKRWVATNWAVSTIRGTDDMKYMVKAREQQYQTRNQLVLCSINMEGQDQKRNRNMNVEETKIRNEDYQVQGHTNWSCQSQLMLHISSDEISSPVDTSCTLYIIEKRQNWHKAIIPKFLRNARITKPWKHKEQTK